MMLTEIMSDGYVRGKCLLFRGESKLWVLSSRAPSARLYILGPPLALVICRIPGSGLGPGARALLADL